MSGIFDALFGVSSANHQIPLEVLEDEADVVVLQPSLGDGLREGDAKRGVENQNAVRYGEGDRVARDHGRELEVEGRTGSLDAANIGADGEEEEGYPKESEEAAELIGAR